MADRILHIAESQNYGCIQCGRCCRRFHVLMSEDEVRRIGRLLASRPNDLPKDFVTRIDGKPYFSRKPTGGCVFLDEETGYCRMHSLFGFRQKALTCGEASAIARMDCPAVQQNAGRPLAAQRKDIKGLASELGLKLAFTKRELEGMGREAVEAMTATLVELVRAPGLLPGARGWAFRDLVARLEKVKPFANDREALAEMLPTLREKAVSGVPERSGKRIGWFARAVFRAWLGACLRRDTELVNPSLGQRLLRAWTMFRVTVGFGSLRPLGWEHPDSSLARCSVFGGKQEPSESGAWDAYWRFLVSRLEAFQFFGVSYYDQSYFVGLKALALTYPLVLAAARHHSRARGAARIEEEDVHYGIGAIDHTHGRSPLLQFDMWRTIEDFLFARWDRLQTSLGWE
jgi:Fe-S-cluster containining protein